MRLIPHKPPVALLAGAEAHCASGDHDIRRTSGLPGARDRSPSAGALRTRSRGVVGDECASPASLAAFCPGDEESVVGCIPRNMRVPISDGAHAGRLL